MLLGVVPAAQPGGAIGSLRRYVEIRSYARCMLLLVTGPPHPVD